ncbi:MAG TPA: molybdate ABC transporter substrate-binding protein [Solirubrobacteraceae bacterium]|jgi:molybdate transport system substrate-binding protein|nr:molybdate ABC transporter substrate-binding protein [Solirubrobacteraceae bacterium]
MVAFLLCLLALAGCGSTGNSSSGGGSAPTLTVSAAASLKDAFTNCAQSFKAAHLRFSFAGSDQLAAQIRQGAGPNVFASANTKLPEQLATEGELSKTQVFAGNKLVIAVPKDSKITSIADLEKPGTKLVIGDSTVPVGAYTRTVIGRLPAARQKAINANVKSEEPDVSSVVGKLTQGAADAGFTYVTDVTGTKGQLKAIDMPANLQPEVAYGAGIVKGTPNQKQAQAFIDDVISGSCRKVMQSNGFLPPPTA